MRPIVGKKEFLVQRRTPFITHTIGRVEGMRNFDYFVRKIPPNIHSRSRSIFSKHMAIFLPEAYVFDQTMDVEEYHFIICFETPPLATINQKQYQFKKGSIICLAPGDHILVHFGNGQHSARYMTVCVLPEFIAEVHQELGGVGKLQFKMLDTRYSHWLLEALEALIHEVVHHGDGSQFMVNSLENCVAVQLIRDAKPTSKWRGGSQPNVEDIVKKACKYIETYYTSNITIKDVSDAIFVSPSYLQKIFPKVAGKTPYQYIMECRHSRACEMLVKTKVPMEKVARQCGFVNSAHFSTAFKHIEGISPLAYRKAHRLHE